MSNRKHILLVEDSADVRANIALVIELLGYEVHMAGNVEEARQRFVEHKMDLVISDLWMPGGNGTELLQEFKRLRPEMPFFILTGFPTEDTLKKTIVSDGFAYVTKPIQGEQLRKLIEHALDESSKQTTNNK
jgi:DNA-binding NtrC family response regulator